jgi:hypothetical protein
VGTFDKLQPLGTENPMSPSYRDVTSLCSEEGQLDGPMTPRLLHGDSSTVSNHITSEDIDDLARLEAWALATRLQLGVADFTSADDCTFYL